MSKKSRIEEKNEKDKIFSENKKEKTSLPVIYNGERTELPITTVINTAKFNPTAVDKEHPNYFAMESNGSVYYISPKVFERAIIEKQQTPKNAEEIRKDVLKK